ncbi:bifunctional diguanylate cyclase/phosphodiesterase [Pseudomonas sp. Gutcm_11s]|uniref:bifunctional diguanylate cyclase/phosphodiesterase n=1 Tax=Pseudomonas sp. Gutcm_11s TaxID=3026088 RepID=UPI00235F1884|nr:PAS domain S-box protein [Pseudomonas sp. Gutcm_11s]MDD0841764.1 PAS domain S-box protein [Pseudomonas sp. Gutcm_11s]
MFNRPLLVAAAYLLFGIAWTLGGDLLLRMLDLAPTTLVWLQTFSALLLAVLGGLLIFFLGRNQHRASQKLQQELQEVALKLGQAQHDAGLGLWQYDGRLRCSAEALQLFERPATETEAGLDDLLGWLYPSDRNAAQRALDMLSREGAPLLINVRLNRPASEPPLWLMLRGSRAEDGSLLGSVQNVSGQKRDEQALRESEQRFRQLFEQTPHIAVQGYDSERRVIFWNQASTQLYGYTLAEALGRRLEELIIPAPMRAKVVSGVSAWMIGGPAIPAAELTLRHRDGNEVHVYSSHLILRNARNQLEMYCVDIDLGRQMAAHQQLEASESRYRELVEQLHEAIFLTDGVGRLTFVNPAWQTVTGYSIQQSIGHPLLDFIEDDQREEVGQYIAAILARQQSSWLGELRLRDANGRAHWVSLRLAAGAQHGLGLRGSLDDIHERRHSQAVQEARNEVLDRMLAQTPLEDSLTDMARRLERISPEMLVSILSLNNGLLRVMAAPSLPSGYTSVVEGMAAGINQGSCGNAAASGELTIVEDIRSHPNWINFREAAQQAGLRACWSLPFKNDQNQVLGVFGIYYRRPARPSREDIELVTEFTRLAGLALRQQQRDAERLQSELRFRSTFEQAAVGIAHLAPDGRWLRVNQRLCQMLGYSREQLLELTFQDITHPDDLDKDLGLTHQLLAGEIPRLTMEKRYLHRDGSVLWANLSATLVRHTNGEPHYFISVVEDIGVRKQQERALQQAATVFESTQEAVVIVDARRRILTSNPAFTSITGLSPEDAIGRRLPLLPDNSLDRSRYRSLWRKVQHSGNWQGEMNSRRRDGSRFPFWLTVSRVRDCDPQQPQYVLTFTDLSQYRDSQERLAHLAHFDPLTDLPNRLYAMERLSHALEHAQRHKERVAVLYFDLDNFKTINESLGHKVGDELLVAVARRLQQRLRNEDTLARLSSDEFLVVLENLLRPEEAASIARTLIELLERPLPLGSGREAYLGASIGISLYPDDGQSSDDLLRNADSALHQAKQEGRNTFRFYTQGLTHQAHTRLTLEGQLRQALKRNEFILHYQPLLRGSDGHAIGVEALLRWNSTDGMISPAQFIPLAEETGLIVPIGNWVLREACRQMQFWRQQGMDLHTLAVNLSPRQFRQADLIQQVREALHDSGLPAEHLELEITEGALIENVEQAQATLAALKELGLKLAIDDFGTGYSSLAYLRRFPLDKLKIDQSFMRGVPEDQANLEIVATIIGLARNLKLCVLAEGVETLEQLQALRQLGCEQCQGYLFSRPLSAVQLAHWLHNDQQSVG